MKFIKINDFLLQKLTYHKDIRVIKIKFLKKVIKFRANIEVVLIKFDRVLKKRSKV